MPKRVNRRQFVKTSAASLAGAVGARQALAAQASPTMITPKGAQPVVISSANGNFDKNGGTETCVERAFRLMTGGTDVLEALIEGVNIVELDPSDTSVGYGGLPNADGVVQLDSCCMHGPKKRAGGVVRFVALEAVGRTRLVDVAPAELGTILRSSSGR